MSSLYHIETILPPPPPNFNTSGGYLQDFWQFGHVGSGRYLIRGSVDEGSTITSLEWRVTDTSEGDSGWHDSGVDFSDEGDFFFWVDPPFQQGTLVTVQLRFSDEQHTEAVFFSETFHWWWEVHDDVALRFRNAYMPDWLRDSEIGQAVYTALAKTSADMYALFEDTINQAFPAKATWSIPEWERHLGMSSFSSLSPAQRRQLVVARRRIPEAGARTHLLQALTSAAGQAPTFVDTYADYVFTTRLPDLPPIILQALQQLGLAIKPVGIQMDFATLDVFLAGIDTAGAPV